MVQYRAMRCLISWEPKKSHGASGRASALSICRQSIGRQMISYHDTTFSKAIKFDKIMDPMLIEKRAGGLDRTDTTIHISCFYITAYAIWPQVGLISVSANQTQEKHRVLALFNPTTTGQPAALLVRRRGVGCRVRQCGHWHEPNGRQAVKDQGGRRR